MGPVMAAAAVESGYVLAGITVVVLPIAAIAFARSGRAWREIGKGPLSIERELPPSRGGQAPPPVDPAVQRAEARQMLEARSYRSARRGGPPVDVEAELSRLLDPPAAAGVDDELRDEVRQLVISGNERRMRRGEEPLDVEAETERQLSDLIGSD